MSAPAAEPAADRRAVRLVLPGALAELAGGERTINLDVESGATVGDVLDDLRERLPALERRLRDEQGALRRHVNVYVDGDDVRLADGLATSLAGASEVLVLPSVAGG